MPTYGGVCCATITVGAVLLFIAGSLYLHENYEPQFQDPVGIFTYDPQASVSVQNSSNRTKRVPGDMKDVAILLFSHSKYETLRWLAGISRERKSGDDFPIFIYPQDGNLGTENWLALKKLKEVFGNLHLVKEQNASEVVNLKMTNEISYVIEINDTHFMGADFGDFYHFGRQVAKLDNSVNRLRGRFHVSSICGGISDQRDEFFDGSQEFTFWLKTGCNCGPMRSKQFYNLSGDPIIDFVNTYHMDWYIYPEVGRVAQTQNFTNYNPWNFSNIDPVHWTNLFFDRRVEADLKNAVPITKEDLKNIKSLDVSKVHFLNLNAEEKLESLFTPDQIQVLDQKMYKSIIPIVYHHRKIYIVKRKWSSFYQI